MNKVKFLALSLLLFLGACAEPSATETANVATSAAPAYKMKGVADETQSGGVPRAINAASPAQPVSLEQAGESKEQPVERKIIRNAELNIEAASPEEAQQKITALAESKGGFVIESQQSSSTVQATTHDRVTMTVRVPAAKFGETLEEIRKIASRVVTETVKGQDVTEEFVDIEARLKVKKAAEAQLLEILKQAKTVDDTLAVQDKLTAIRSEIEQIEGRKRFLENQTGLSTIKLTVQTPTAFSANTSGFLYQIERSFSSGFNFALSFILGLITFIIAILPFCVFVVLPGYLIARYFWRRSKKLALAKKLAQEENVS